MINEIQCALEKNICSLIEESHRISKIPSDMVKGTANSCLDIISSLIETALKIEIPRHAQNSVSDRFKTIVYSSVAVLSLKAHELVDPYGDYVLNKKSWATEKLHVLQIEARRFRTEPEVVIMDLIRARSVQLKGQLEHFKQNAIFEERDRNSIEHLEILNDQLMETEDLYQLKDEMLEDATLRLAEIYEYIANFLPGRLRDANSQDSDPTIVL